MEEYPKEHYLHAKKPFYNKRDIFTPQSRTYMTTDQTKPTKSQNIKKKPTYTKKRRIYTKRDLFTPKKSYIHDDADKITE